ncbi:MAG: 30S ribosomal protein S17 [Ignavibacteria bacterium]|jgi:small subunit ribosomal protein S17|nr:30S ribosomal protein S17 [Ignavibacteria bacterium]
MSEETIKKTSHKRVMQGKVTSNKAEQTIIVAVERQVMHPLYKKYFKSTKKFMAHDPEKTCNIGDVVKIRECRPLSARKRWMFDGVVTRAK